MFKSVFNKEDMRLSIVIKVIDLYSTIRNDCAKLCDQLVSDDKLTKDLAYSCGIRNFEDQFKYLLSDMKFLVESAEAFGVIFKNDDNALRIISDLEGWYNESFDTLMMNITPNRSKFFFDWNAKRYLTDKELIALRKEQNKIAERIISEVLKENS